MQTRRAHEEEGRRERPPTPSPSPSPDRAYRRPTEESFYLLPSLFSLWNLKYPRRSVCSLTILLPPSYIEFSCYSPRRMNEVQRRDAPLSLLVDREEDISISVNAKI
eukprot:scaffold173560_cov27-Tisochrysis_lutea.AAC.3